MDYFKLFGLKPSLVVDSRGLQDAYVALQKDHHPDFFGQAGAFEQIESLEKSTLINQAYRVLQSPMSRLKYLLEQKGLTEDEHSYKMPPDFLMEVMELNEMKMEGGTEEEIKIKSAELTAAITNPVSTLLQAEDMTQFTAGDWEILKKYYYQKRYMDRLRGKLK